MSEIQIAGHKIGPGHPCFVIAEAGVNHNGSMDLARKLIDTAAEAGAHAVKFQTFSTEALVTESAPKADYQERILGKSESQFAMLKQLELDRDNHFALQSYAQERGLIFLSTPFDDGSVDLLVELDVPAFKVSSGDLTNLPLLEKMARTGRPMIVSTGMGTLAEVEEAVAAIRASGNPPLVLLQCVSRYPADPATTNLRAMATMEARFGVPVGYSDHTLGIEISLAAVALGACVVEKHLTLDCTLPGPDHQASLDPTGFVALMRGVHAVESSLGDGRKEPTTDEALTAAVARKSVVSACDIAAGESLTDAALTIKRPGNGFPPARRQSLIGRTARVAIPAGTVLTPEMLT
jgi:N,N'-diacetyllegionaminate synthase